MAEYIDTDYDTLAEVIENNPGVSYVYLIWSGTKKIRREIENERGESEVYLYDASYIDSEYSFSGLREDALEYAHNYNQWDGVLSKGYYEFFEDDPLKGLLFCCHPGGEELDGPTDDYDLSEEDNDII